MFGAPLAQRSQDMEIMKKKALLGGAYVLESSEFHDQRGLFMECYREEGLNLNFVQGNLSISARNVVRGLHYQVGSPQGKLMRTIVGATCNVIVDLREGSPTFGRAGSTTLERPGLALWVPPGFANGFATLSEQAVVIYETTSYYRHEGDRALFAFDPAFEGEWPGHIRDCAIMSDKDRAAPPFAEADIVPRHEWDSSDGATS